MRDPTINGYISQPRNLFRVYTVSASGMSSVREKGRERERGGGRHENRELYADLSRAKLEIIASYRGIKYE